MRDRLTAATLARLTAPEADAKTFPAHARFYIAFKRIKNFACVEFRPTTGKILIFVKVDPAKVQLEPGFTRDVSNIGHFGTGDLEITLSKAEDLERAKLLIERSYGVS